MSMLVFSTTVSRQIQPLERGFLILIMSSYKFLKVKLKSHHIPMTNHHSLGQIPMSFYHLKTAWLLFPPSGDVAFFDHLQKRDGGIFIGHIAEHLLRTSLHSHLVLWSHDDVWPVVYKRNMRRELVNGKKHEQRIIMDTESQWIDIILGSSKQHGNGKKNA